MESRTRRNRTIGLVRIAGAILVAVMLAAVWTPGARRAQGQGSIVVSVDFEYIRQGTAGVVRVNGPGLIGGVAAALDRTFPFFPTAEGVAALIAAPIETRIRRDYPMEITVYLENGTSARVDSTLRVESGEFIREEQFTIPSDRMHLLNMDVQNNENAELISIYSVVTPERFWEGQFTYPANAPLTSPFGSVRDYNDGSTRRHTGTDFRLNSGTPIVASASGRVVFARGLDIHGYTVIIDHGWGVFSAYSHFSQIYVVPGQRVLQGDIIGLSGNTGRSTGPHLHWEIAVNGVWVNPLTFAGTRLPS